MTNNRHTLADTLRKQKETQPAVADTFTSDTPNLNRRTTIYLEQETWIALKKRSIDEGKNLSEIINALAKEYLNR